MQSYEVTFNHSKGAEVSQHIFNSDLEKQDFEDLMREEWLIDITQGDDITVRLMATAE